ncbi:hypothetical protein IT570_06975 [Candidatus Sumerlaeota bacterium]|nr:hypothetical protein [Candidatus Sumerlaeota bacterium]
MLQLLINRAKVHFNNAVAHAGEGHLLEALGELETALELNGRLTEALVLRGTILARLNRMDEAQDAWRTALQLNPQAMRAHKNLLTSGELPKALPALNRSFAMALIAVIVAVGITGAFLLNESSRSGEVDQSVAPSQRPRTQVAETTAISGAWKALYEHNIAEAANTGATIQDDRERIRFNDALEAEIESRVFTAEQHERNNEDREARQQLEGIDSQLLPSRLRTRYNAITTRLDAKLANASRELLDSTLGRANKAIEAGDETGFQSAIREIGRLDDPKGENAARVADLQARMKARGKELLFGQVSSSLARKNWRGAIMAADRLAKEGEMLDVSMATSLEDARRQLALQSYYELMEMGDKIDSGQMSEAEARQVLQLADEASEALPPRIRPRAEENIASFTASANKRLQSSK